MYKHTLYDDGRRGNALIIFNSPVALARGSIKPQSIWLQPNLLLLVIYIVIQETYNKAFLPPRLFKTSHPSLKEG